MPRKLSSNMPIPITVSASAAIARTLGSVAASSPEMTSSVGSASSGSPSPAALQALATPRPFGVNGST